MTATFDLADPDHNHEDWEICQIDNAWQCDYHNQAVKAGQCSWGCDTCA